MPENNKLVPILVKIAKALVLLGLVVYLCYRIKPQHLSVLSTTRDWPMLTGAFALALAAVCITFTRWYLLVRALDLKFRLSDAFRLGFLGYLLNFVAPSSVGGDLFKAIFIAREQKGRRAEAVATVVVDRIIGLYALVLVTSIAILCVQLPSDKPAIQAICNMTLVAALIGGIGIGLLLFAPGLTNSLARLFQRVPKVGEIIHRIVAAIAMYRAKPMVITAIGLMSLVSHSMFAISIFLIATALYGGAIPTLPEHFIIGPLSMVAGAIPLAPGGLGIFESAMMELYTHVPVGQTIAAGMGISIAIVFRLITIAIAGVGGLYYLASRRELRSVIQQARTSEEVPA